MANIASFPLVVSITGDNVATSVVVGLGYTPTSATLVTAYDSNSQVVSGNISSVVAGSSQVTINFVAAFSGTIQVVLALSNATCSNSQLQPVTGTFWQATQPVSGTITAVTAITNALPTGANTIGKADILGNAGATLDSTIGAATAPTNAIATSAVFQSTVPTVAAGQAVAVQCDTTGSSYVNVEGRKATYRAVATAITFISGASPTFSLTGSASKTVRITRIRFSATAATGAVADVAVARFSALSGGTSAAVTVAKLDTNNAAATAAPLTWSVAATTATLVALLTSERYEIVTAAVTVLPELIEWEFGNINSQAMVLRGTSDFMGLKISATGTTPVGDIWIEWTEE